MWLLIAQYILTPALAMLQLYTGGQWDQISRSFAGWILQIGLLLVFGTGLLLLLHRRSASLDAARFFFWLSIVVAPFSLLIVLMPITWTDRLWLVVSVVFTLMLPVGWIGYLANSPRVALCYPRRYPNRSGWTAKLLQSGTGMQGNWPINMLMAYGLASFCASVLLFLNLQTDVPLDLHQQGPKGFADVDGLQHWLDVLQPALRAAAVLVLLLWRRWIGVQLVIVTLWLPLLTQFCVSLLLSRHIAPANAFTVVGFSKPLWLAAGWSGYLLNAPYIDKHYPGRQRRKTLATDVF